MEQVSKGETPMAKKFGKFLLATAAIGAVAAGVYYYLQEKENFTDDDFDDDDFDNFDEDLDEDETGKSEDRNYVDLGLEKAKTEEFKEGLDAAKAQAEEKVVGAVKDAAEKTETKVEEFFDDEDEASKEE